MEFYPKHKYKEFNIVPRNIEYVIELNFIKCLELSIKKECMLLIETIYSRGKKFPEKYFSCYTINKYQ